MNTAPAACCSFGFVKPPLDYAPAIAALSPAAREKMHSFLALGLSQDQAIAQAADWDNEQPRSR